VITFQVTGDPVGQPRTRSRAFIPRGQTKPRSMMYDPHTADGWKALIKLAAKPHTPAQPFTGAVSVKLMFSFARPKSHFRTGKFAGELKLGAPYFVTSKPDNDNLEKATWDAITDLTGFWRDDCQIAHNETLKIYGAAGGLVVEINPLEAAP